MDEGAWRKLTPSSKLKYLEAEKNIRKTHLEITKTMSITELKELKKHEYRDLMKKEMYDMVPQLTETVVHTACHYISEMTFSKIEREVPNLPLMVKEILLSIGYYRKICLNLFRKCHLRTMFWMILLMVTYMMLCLAQVIASQLKTK